MERKKAKKMKKLKKVENLVAAALIAVKASENQGTAKERIKERRKGKLAVQAVAQAVTLVAIPAPVILARKEIARKKLRSQRKI